MDRCGVRPKPTKYEPGQFVPPGNVQKNNEPSTQHLNHCVAGCYRAGLPAQVTATQNETYQTQTYRSIFLNLPTSLQTNPPKSQEVTKLMWRFQRSRGQFASVTGKTNQKHVNISVPHRQSRWHDQFPPPRCTNGISVQTSVNSPPAGSTLPEMHACM